MPHSTLLKPNFRKLIGNDIVDLALAEKQSNWKRNGYLQKIFTEAEQRLILESTTPNKTVWILWSMKESAYKIFSRETGVRNYAPTTLICSNVELNITNAIGVVCIAGKTYFTASTIDEQKIHTVCTTLAAVVKQIKVIITAPHNRPLLKENSKRHQCISHHGAFIAQAFLEQDFPQSAGL